MANAHAGADADSPRIDQLEQRFAQSQQLIEQLTGQLQAMRKEIEALKSVRSQSDASLAKANSQRLDEVEESVFDLDDKTSGKTLVKGFDAQAFNVGGFLHSTLTYVDGDRGDAVSFDRQNFELLVGAKIADNWSAFFAGGFLRESDDPLGGVAGSTRENPRFNSRNKNPEIIAWAQYEASNAFKVRIGRINTPHGIINIEHFPAILLDPEQPQFLRPFSGATLFPNFSTGVQVLGDKFFANGDKLSYAAYVSNFSGNANHGVFGGRLAFKHGAMELGLNSASGQRVNGDTYHLYGVDFFYDQGRFQLKSEGYVTDEGFQADRFGGYVQPAFRLTDQWMLFYRYDILDKPGLDSTENTVGVNFLPRSNIRLRAIYRHRSIDHDLLDNVLLPDASVDEFQLSATLSF